MINKNIHYLVLLIVYLVINVLFISKYTMRITDNPLIILFICSLYILSVIFVLFKVNKNTIKISSHHFWITFIFITTILIVLQYSVDPLSLKVDRWSAIHNWWNNLICLVYPYSAHTHLGGYGSPFPVWQLIHFPFYLMNNVGLSIFFFTGLFLYYLAQWKNYTISFIALVLLLLSPSFVYEVIVRSDLISNFLLVLAIIIFLIIHELNLNRNTLLLSLLFGLLLSTRLSAIIPFIIYYFNEYIHLKLKKQIIVFSSILVIFLITFIWLFIWDSDLFFFEYNPFVLQTRQGNTIDFVLFIPLGIFVSLSWKNNPLFFLYNTGLYLLVFVCITFIHNMIIQNDFDALFSSKYDISYFNMGLPFIITALSIIKYK